MRLAAQIKGGYYPAPPDAVAHCTAFLKPPRGGSFCLLAPCCGEGAALTQLAATLTVAADLVYCIELDPERKGHIALLMPFGHLEAWSNRAASRPMSYGGRPESPSMSQMSNSRTTRTDLCSPERFLLFDL
ncbi:MAG: hypothetical protein DWQ34_03395 [Planctomycetota bacterium]|nr:MAG: hypothetical protein DWQ29_04785 [Planctomycetota bacterium]REJ96746.1 MAG: hypothetical protein DWQ34_03395 [Planctomycetota bacterium]REK25156.1 MAG: hypothetical protein DWQ41_12640 [Planctomycetota bacterium]REK38797.1 MAG: hypothetical protein DWQ45_02825 [Planctomycetota bacterium]